MSGGAQWRAHDLLRSGIGHDGLRDQLRRAIVLRDASRHGVADAQAEVDRIVAVEANARAALDRFRGIDAQRDTARVAAIRAGRPPADDPVIIAKLVEREAARVHLGDAGRAVNAVRAELAQAQVALSDKQEHVEALAAAVTAAEIERLADRLEDTERAAAALRAVVAAVAGTYVSVGFAAPFPLPVSERTKGLLRDVPANVRPRADNPGLRIEDDRTRAAFRAHAAALLKDADAPLATELK